MFGIFSWHMVCFVDIFYVSTVTFTTVKNDCLNKGCGEGEIASELLN